MRVLRGVNSTKWATTGDPDLAKIVNVVMVALEIKKATSTRKLLTSEVYAPRLSACYPDVAAEVYWHRVLTKKGTAAQFLLDFPHLLSILPSYMRRTKEIKKFFIVMQETQWILTNPKNPPDLCWVETQVNILKTIDAADLGIMKWVPEFWEMTGMGVKKARTLSKFVLYLAYFHCVLLNYP